MADPVSLQQLRVQVRLEEDDASQDIDLIPKLAAAVRAVENETGRFFEGTDPLIDEKDLPTAKLAVLMLAAHWYRNREAVVVNATGVELPGAFKFLINPISKMAV